MRTDVLLAAPPAGASAPAPVIFDGLLEPGAQAAQALLVLGRVARSRFFTPPAMLARLIAESDPVLSADGQTLRAEAFSLCCGVHARLDVPPDGSAGATIASGCTNVDLSEPTRDLLAGVTGVEPLALTVRGDGIRLRTLDGDADESRARLPRRWVQGFAEIAAVTAAMTPVARLGSAEARSFLRAIPARGDGNAAWAVPSGSGLRLARRQTPGSVPAGGVHRLRILEPLLRFATGLTVFAPAAGQAGVWVLELDRARFSVTLSPTPSRGFSGEGGWLSLLADDLVASEVAGGRVGFDLVAGEWFDRPLPVPDPGAEAMNPRLAKALMLAEAGAVRPLGAGSYEITHGESVQRVRLEPDGCTCPWWARHGGQRGPCSHVLAARLSAQA